MKNKTRILSIFLIFFVVVSFSGCGCKKQTTVGYEISLEVWGLFDDQDDYAEIFGNYTKINPQVSSISYRKLSPDTYRADILEALAAGKGPDILLIHNTWLPGFQDKLVPAPKNAVSVQQVRQEFVDAVSDDFVRNNEIYALPLSVDSLALFYNKDILNRTGITTPPSSWEEFGKDAQDMTTIDGYGNITQSGASLGTAYNINRSTDILNLLFFQNGVDVNSQSNDFGVEISGTPAQEALRLYSQFADSSSDPYTWNALMHYSLDAFSEGTLAMMLNYSWQIETLKNKSPKLNFGVASVPQLNENEKVTYANYWGYAVVGNKTIVQENNGRRAPTQTERIQEAWNFIGYLTLGQAEGTFDSAASYLERTQKPAARRDLIENQKDDLDLGVFALGNLYAQSLTQYNPESTEAILAEMIEKISRGETTYRDALFSAQSKINKLAP